MIFLLISIFLSILTNYANCGSVKLIEYCIDNMELEHCSSMSDNTNILWNLWVVLDNFFMVETYTPCVNLGFDFYWSIKEMKSDVLVKEFEEFKHRSMLLLPAYSMKMGEYVLQLAIGHKATTNTKHFQCLVRFKPVSVIAAVSGAMYKPAHSGDVLKLDGSYSYEGGNPNVTYDWELKPQASSESNTLTPIRKSGKVVHVTVEGVPGTNWMGRLMVTSGFWKDRKTFVITIVEPSEPLVDIICNQNCPPAGNFYMQTFLTLSLEAVCYKNCDKIAKFGWLFMTDDVERMHTHGFKDSRVTIKYFQFTTPHPVVTVQLELYGHSSSEDAFNFLVFSLPHTTAPGGNIECPDVDRDGMELLSVFHIKCNLVSEAPVTYKLTQYVNTKIEFTLMKSVVPEYNVRLSTKSNSSVIKGNNAQMLTLERIELETNISSDYPNMYKNVKSIVEEMYSDEQIEATLCPSPTKLGKEGRVWEAVQVINALMPKLIEEETDDEAKHFTIAFTTRLYQDMLLFPTDLVLDSLILILHRLMRPIEEPKILENALALSHLCRHLALKRRDDLRINALLYEVIITKEYEVLHKCANYLMDSNYYKAGAVQVTTPPPMANHPVIEEDYPSYGEVMTNLMKDECIKITNNTITIAQLASEIRIITWPYGILERTVDNEYFQSDRASLIDRHIKMERCEIHLPENIGFGPDDKLRLFANIFNESLFFWTESELVVNTVLVSLLIIDDNGKEVFRFPARADVFLHISNQTETTSYKENASLPTGQSEYNDTNVPVFTIEMQNSSTVNLFIRNISEPLRVVMLDGRRPVLADFNDSMLVMGNEHRIYVPISTHDTWIFLGILPASAVEIPETLENLLFLEMKANSTTNNTSSNSTPTFLISVLTQECVEWKGNIWFQADCNIGNKSNETTVQCQCYSIHNVAAFSKIAGYTRRNLIIINFTLTYQPNFIPLLLIVGVILFYCIAVLFAVCRGKAKQQIFYLSDNLPRDNYAYLVQVLTNAKLGSGTSSNIAIKIYGKEAKSRAHILNYPDPDKNLLQSGNEDYFVLTSRRHLGDLKAIDLWSDCLDIRPSWICDTIKICDLQKRKWYFFEVENLFLPIDDYKYHISVKVDDVHTTLQRKKLTFKRLIMRFRLRFGAEHTWNIFSRTHDTSIYYVERISVIYLSITSTYAASMLICVSPVFALVDTIYDNVLLHYVDILKYSLFTSLITFPISMGAVFTFRNLTRAREYKFFYFKKILPEKFKYICWVVIFFISITSTVYIVVMGSGISLQAGYGWLIVATASLLANILIFENVYLGILDIIVWQKRPTIIYKYENIVQESQQQKIYLKYMVPGRYTLRPYLVHLYKPMNLDRYDRKRNEIEERFRISKTFRDFIAFLIYFLLMFSLLTLNLSDHRIVLNEHMTDMMIGQVNGTSLRRVKSSEKLIKYLNDTLTPTLHAYTWYDGYSSNDPGLMLDFQTKLLGVARIRQKRVNATDCLDKKLSAKIFAVTQCLPLYSSKYESRVSQADKQTLWKYNTAKENGRTINTGELGTYFGSGYVTHTGRILANAYFMINAMVEEKWIDIQTRVILLEFWTYNANKNLFSIVTITFEFYPTGYILNNHDIYTLSLMFSDSGGELTVAIVFFLYCFLIFYQVGSLISKMVIDGNQFWTSLSNYLDMAIVLLNVFLIGLFVHKQIVVEGVLDDLTNHKKNKFTKYFAAIYYDDLITIYIALLMCISVLGTWRFLRFGLMFKIFERAMRQQIIPVLSAFLYSCIFYCQYFIISYILFHSYSRIFRGVGSTLTVICLLGLQQYKGYDHEELQNTLPVVSRLFYGFYHISVLVFINIYVAVITLHYEDSRSYILRHSREYNILNYFIEEIKYLVKFASRRKKYLIGGTDYGHYGSTERRAVRYMKRRNVSRKFEDEEQSSGIIYIQRNKLEFLPIVILIYLWNRYLRTNRRCISTQDYHLMESLAYYFRHQNEGEVVAYYPMKLGNKHRFHYVSSDELSRMETLSNELFDARPEEAKPRAVERRDNVSLSRLEVLAKRLSYADKVIGNINVKRMRGGRIVSVESF